ncbi:MAG: DNA-binding protein, partial [Oscillospiraceae bacterium]|nr:DNA-binding protein [Oscillospiraceae bacterium]
MKKLALAFDTSNYTTSCAFFDGDGGDNSGRLLDVPAGALGLRQSEALFSHVRRLPEVFEKLNTDGEIIAVGASTKPRETEDSYMPCFLAGASQAQVMAKSL